MAREKPLRISSDSTSSSMSSLPSPPAKSRGFLGSIWAFIRALALILLNEKSPQKLCLIFLLNFSPVLLWITTFKEARLIPASIRPPIHVDLLPRWEHFLYETPVGLIGQCVVLTAIYYAVIRSPWALLAGAIPIILDIEWYLAQNLNAFKDVLAWISYGVIHFVSPYLTANIVGIATHLTFPNAAPWYQTEEYGQGYPPKPGNYSMPGSAAGLKRVDAVLGIHLYDTAFRASPLVFGAFPSLHSGFAVLNFYFIARYSPKRGKWLLGAFVFWQWWSTIYLLHHWRVDLVGGALYSTAVFLFFLPSLRKYENRMKGRWSGWARLWYYEEWSGYQVLQQLEVGEYVHNHGTGVLGREGRRDEESDDSDYST